METFIGAEIPAKFLEVDEESERLVFSHRRASSSADMQGYKVGGRVGGWGWGGGGGTGRSCWGGGRGGRGIVAGAAGGSKPLPARASTRRTRGPLAQRAVGRWPRGLVGHLNGTLQPNQNQTETKPKPPPSSSPPPNKPKVGDVVVGVVQSVRPYGAFVDIGGAIGLLHISQITHERLTTVDQVLAEGDKLKVMILSQDTDRGRVTLSTKKLEPEPGDMLRDPQKVFENADRMAEAFKQRVAAADSAALGSYDAAGEYPALDAGYPPPGAPMGGAEQGAAFDA